MTAPNHALTGAVLGLSIANPVIALPVAFLSHFLCDLVPHYDLAEQNEAKRIASKRFVFEFIVAGATLCVLLVVVLALARPTHWFQAAICAFLAASPDLFWIPRFLRVHKGKKDMGATNMFLRFHSAIQWKTGPRLIWLEAVWFVVFGSLVVSRL